MRELESQAQIQQNDGYLLVAWKEMFPPLMKKMIVSSERSEGKYTFYKFVFCFLCVFYIILCLYYAYLE